MNKIIFTSLIIFFYLNSLYAQEILLDVPINRTDSISDVSIFESQTKFYWGDFKDSYSTGIDETDSSAIQLGMRRYFDVFTDSFPSETESKDIIISIDLKFDRDDVMDFNFPTTRSSVIIGASNDWYDSEQTIWAFSINYQDSSLTDNFGLTAIKIPDISNWNSFQFILKNSDSTISVMRNNQLVSSKKLSTSISLTATSALRVGAYPPSNSEYLYAHIDNIKIKLFDQLNDIVTSSTVPNNNYVTLKIEEIFYFDLNGRKYLEHELTTGRIYIKQTLFSDGSVEVIKIMK